MRDHEIGGQRHSADPNRTESIPEAGGARANPGTKTTPSRWPRAIMSRNHRGLEHYGPKQQGMKNKTYAVYGPVRAFYKQNKKGGTNVKGRLRGSRYRYGSRYFYLDVTGIHGPMRLLLQRTSKSGKGKNKVWYVIVEGGRIHLQHNLMWESMVPSIEKMFGRHLQVELTKALMHGRTLP